MPPWLKRRGSLFGLKVLLREDSHGLYDESLNQVIPRAAARGMPVPLTVLSAWGGVLSRPSKANHLLRYFRVLFGWGMRYGHCKTNPAEGAKQVKERKRHGMPARDVYEAVLNFARERGAVLAHASGHKSEAMVDLYDREVAVVDPASPGEAEGIL